MSQERKPQALPEYPWSATLDLLHAIALAGTEASDEDALLERATRIVGELLRPDNFGVMLLDRERGVLTLHPSYRRSPNMKHLEAVPLGRGITGHVAQSKEPVCAGDVSRNPYYIPVNPQVQSEMCVPLMINEEVIGVVDVESCERDAFSEVDQQVLITLTAQLATAIDRLRRTAEARQQAQRIATIYEVGRQITAILHLEELLPTIVQLIRERLNLDGVQIALIEDGRLVCRASHQPACGVGQSIELPEEGTPLGDVIHRGKAYTLTDVTEMIDLCDVGITGVSAEMVVPLRLNSAIIGALLVTCRHPPEKTMCEIALLEFLANQVAVAIQNAQLFTATSRKTQELSTLYETALVTSSVLDPSRLVTLLYEQIEPLLAPERFHLVLYEPSREHLDVVFTITQEQKKPQILTLHRSPEEDELTGWVIRNRAPLLVADTKQEKALDEPERRAWLGVPLIAHDQLIGVLSVSSSKAHAFTPDHRRFLTSVAHQVAIALSNARLHHQAVTTAERLAILHWSGQQLISIRADAEEVYRAIHKTTARLMKSEAFVIALLDREREEIYFPYLVDRGRRRRPHRIPQHRGLSGHIIATGRSRLIPDVQQLADVNAIDFHHFGDPEHVRSILAVTLRLRGVVFGMISTQSYRPRAYSPEDQRLLEMLASDAAIALENARLFIAERQRRRELEAVRQAGLHLTSNLELEPVLQEILKHALDLVNADDTHIFLYEDDTLRFGAVRWANGVHKTPFASPRPHGLTYTVARSGKQIVVEDIHTHPLFRDADWEGAIVGLPLRLDQEVIGVMNVAFVQPHRFSENELRVLSLLADQAAIAIRNARLFTKAQERAAELAEALQRLKHLDEMKSQFIQNTSHELRTPVTLIRGHAELLEQGELGPLKPKQQQSIGVIARRSRMLSKMLEDLNVILSAEKRQMERTPVNLVSLLQRLLEEFHVQAREADLKLEASLKAQEALVLGSEVHLRRVVDNLVDNAIKFTSAGGKISLRFWKEEGYGVLEVSDTGIGIPKEHQKHIFERFYQVDGSMTRRYGGTGLGLALVKEIIEAHGGQVSVESEPRKGSTFRVRLPLWENEAPT